MFTELQNHSRLAHLEGPIQLAVHLTCLRICCQVFDAIWEIVKKKLGYTAHVMTFEVGAVLEDPNWQAPLYCFSEAEKEKNSPLLGPPSIRGSSLGSLMRGILVPETM